jgi:uncharacterized protein YjlB
LIHIKCRLSNQAHNYRKMVDEGVMTQWVRFTQQGRLGFGTLEGESIAVHAGDMFSSPAPTGRMLARSEVDLATPCDPS